MSVTNVSSLLHGGVFCRNAGCDGGVALHPAHNSVQLGGVRYADENATALVYLFPLHSELKELQVRTAESE